MPSPNLHNLDVGVWGYGREGRAAFDYLTPRARTITVVDERNVPLVSGSVPVRYVGTDPAAFLDCDIVFVSPGVPMTNSYIQTLMRHSVALTSGTAWWMKQNFAQTIGVTGTKGKSTTAAIIQHLLSRSIDRRCILMGNVGQPLLTVPDPLSTVVAELSSYQCALLTKSPRVAVITNLFEEHISWHGSVAQYWSDKAKIFTMGAEHLICDLPTLQQLHKLDIVIGAETKVHIIDNDSDTANTPHEVVTIEIPKLPAHLQIPHNLQNVKCAVIAAAVANPQIFETFRPADLLASFTPLDHRLERVAVSNNTVWIEDCLSTTPESVVAAAESVMGNGTTVLIIGGLDRGISYQKLNSYLCSRAAEVRVIAIPSNGTQATQGFADCCPERRHEANGLAQAVELAGQLLNESGGTVILSPGAPSFDYYRDYTDKAQHYRQEVEQWIAKQ